MSCILARKARSRKDACAATAAGHNRRARSIGQACMGKRYEKQRLDKWLRSSTSTSMSGVFNMLPSSKAESLCSGEHVDVKSGGMFNKWHVGAERRRVRVCRAPRCARASMRRRQERRHVQQVAGHHQVVGQARRRMERRREQGSACKWASVKLPCA